MLKGTLVGLYNPLVGQDSLLIQLIDTAWLGTFEGELQIFSGEQLMQEIEMKLIHEELPGKNEWRWAIQYGNGDDAIRDYTLKKGDQGKNHFLIDEHNSILIDQYLFDNKFISWYDVSGSLILVVYTLEEDVLIFEVIAGSSDAGKMTGGETVDDEEIPEVISFPVNVYQKAMLKRRTE